MFGYIYITTNLINNTKYIGQKKYMKDHDKYLGSGKLITAAIKKYGAENFKKEIIEECLNREELNKAEIKWIKRYNAVDSKEFYNLASGGEGQINPSVEIRERISKGNLGKKMSEEAKRKISESHKGEKAWQYGKKLSEEHRRHLSENHADFHGEKSPNYGRHWSQETREKISNTLKTTTSMCDEYRELSAQKTMIPVYCITNNTLYISGIEAARQLGLDSSIIVKICKGKAHTTKGYVFRYATKEEAQSIRKV